MKKYKFQNFNVEIINPNVTVVGLADGNPNITEINFLNKQYTVQIKLETTDAKFYLFLDGVQAVSLDWVNGSNNNNNNNNITQQVLDRLEDFVII